LVLAVLAAPALVQMGINAMAAHLFVFFFGILGISVRRGADRVLAAGVAGTDPVRTTTWLSCFLLLSM